MDSLDRAGRQEGIAVLAAAGDAGVAPKGCRPPPLTVDGNLVVGASPAVPTHGATSDHHWTLELVRERERDLLLRLFELYLYDFSEMEHADVDQNGLFQPPALPFVASHWQEPDRHAFLLRVAGKPAGFALLCESSPMAESAGRRYLSGFFVLRAYRRRGYGAAMAHELFARFPGPWQVLEVRDNPRAQAFWRRVIGEATGNRFQERWLNEREIVQEFEIAGKAS
jgi:predicted acetyltransferase